jgi:ImpA, N-terminal, type VI secretion system
LQKAAIGISLGKAFASGIRSLEGGKRMAEAFTNSLLPDISAEEPCGPDLERNADPEFMNYMVLTEGILPGSYFNFYRGGVDFSAALAAGKKLLSRTHDLRLIVLLAKLSILNLDLEGFARWIGVIAHLLRDHWDAVHPRAEDGDFTLRLVQLATLDDHPVVMAPLQNVPLAQMGNTVLTFRHQLVALGDRKPLGWEIPPDATKIDEILVNEDLANLKATLKSLRDIKKAIGDVRTAFLERSGFSQAPSFEILTPLVNRIAAFIQGAIARRDPNAERAPDPIDLWSPARSYWNLWNPQFLATTGVADNHLSEEHPSLDYSDLAELEKRLGNRVMMKSWLNATAWTGFFNHAIAVRAAMRALPAMHLADQEDTNSALQIFRGVAAPWAAVAYCKNWSAFLPQAAAAAWNYNRVNGRGSVLVARAARAACRTFAGRNDGAADAIEWSEAAGAILVAAAAGDSITSEPTAESAAKLYSDSVASDAIFLAGGGNEADLVSRRLWPDSEPEWWIAGWHRIVRRLMDAGEDWDVWIRWFDRRRQGQTADASLEIFRVTQPPEFWLQPTGTINMQIKSKEIELGSPLE